MIRNYFICVIQFTCPLCGARSSEDVVVDSTGTDPKQAADRLAEKEMGCQNPRCQKPLPPGNHVHINVRPGTVEDVRALGYNPHSREERNT